MPSTLLSQHPQSADLFLIDLSASRFSRRARRTFLPCNLADAPTHSFSTYRTSSDGRFTQPYGNGDGHEQLVELFQQRNNDHEHGLLHIHHDASVFEHTHS